MPHKPLKPTVPSSFILALFGVGILPLCSLGGDLDTIGATLLWQVDATLKGNGVRGAQAEASSGAPLPDFEVNPAAVGQPADLFTWVSSLGSDTTFPNTVGTESGHANVVGGNFYGLSTSPAPQVTHVDNYDANYFVDTYILGATQPSISARVVNQSWIAPGENTTLDPAYDNYAARYGTIFCSGVGNFGTVAPPGTSYNSLAVGTYGTSSAVGPTPDGRCKPDLVAPDAAQYPQSANSYAIPYAAGAAAVLVQAATRGDGGADMVSAATNLITIKALLLNGAIKPSDWTNSSSSPLDLRYGAGILNLFNAWHQLTGGAHSYIETTSSSAENPHPPSANPNSLRVLTGWDFNTITNGDNSPNTWDQVNHYYFSITNTSTLTATLVWNRPRFKTDINDLNLFLYNTANSNLVAASVSSVDNVEHLFLSGLPPGRYDLQVLKAASPRVLPFETYALAFEFLSVRLSLSRSESNVVLSWPIAPTGFSLYSSPSLSSAAWSFVNSPVTTSSGQNSVTLPASAATQFFRLQRP